MNKFVEVSTASSGVRITFYPSELARLESPGPGGSWHGIGAYITLKCGRSIEAREGYDSIKRMLREADKAADYGSVMDNQVK